MEGHVARAGRRLDSHIWKGRRRSCQYRCGSGRGVPSGTGVAWAACGTWTAELELVAKTGVTNGPFVDY